MTIIPNTTGAYAIQWDVDAEGFAIWDTPIVGFDITCVERDGDKKFTVTPITLEPQYGYAAVVSATGSLSNDCRHYDSMDELKAELAEASAKIAEKKKQAGMAPSES